MPAEDRYARPLDLPPGRLLRQVDEPIRVGSLLWVFTDPHRGHELAYNRWYERDHYYAGCMIGAWTVAGSRWVATRRHKEVRLPGAARMPFPTEAGSYACVYYVLDGRHDEWIDWATPQANWLYEVDRGFQSRTHHNTGTYRHEWRAYRDRDPVPVELALDHRYEGLVALFVDPASPGGQRAVDDWFEEHLAGWLRDSPVASVSSWSPVPLRSDKPDFVPVDPAAERRTLQLHFVEGDPLESWDHHRELVDRIERAGVATVALAAPFVPTDIGTDRYVDELW